MHAPSSPPNGHVPPFVNHVRIGTDFNTLITNVGVQELVYQDAPTYCMPINFGVVDNIEVHRAHLLRGHE
jgi:hypothetical protein